MKHICKSMGCVCQKRRQMRWNCKMSFFNNRRNCSLRTSRRPPIQKIFFQIFMLYKQNYNLCVGSGQDWNRLDHQKGNHGKKTNSILGTLLGDLKVLRSKYCKGAVEGKRGRGRPPISWTDDIKKVSGQGMKGATQMAGERVAWRALAKTTVLSALQRHLKLMMMITYMFQIWLILMKLI